MPSAASDMMRLASDFPQASEADWRKLVDGVLKGAPFEKLISKTADGIAISPLYPRAANAAAVAARPLSAPWAIMQRVDNPDAAEANKQLLHDLENGATGFTLTIEGGKGARGFGLPATEQAIKTALAGVHFDAGIAIEVDLAPLKRDAALQVAALVKAHGDPAKVDLRTGFDPIGATAAFGVPLDWPAVATTFGKTIHDLVDQGFKGPLAVADGRVIHDASGSEAQELAFVLATGVAYLRAMESAGVSLATACGMIEVRLSADADQFLTMAKFRAVRKLWARIEQSCGVSPKPLVVAAETAWRMLTQRDPSVNMLRATMATFAAGVAGADSITVLPHTLALGLPDGFARRVARNTQLILLEESNLDKVSDPAAGSGAIETLTKQLCDAAWAQFQEIERAGGIVAALASGLVQKNVAAVREARARNIGRRKDVLTGASEFPNLQEAVPAVLRMRSDATPDAGALAPIRLAAPFEALRDRSDAILARTGLRPKVLLATLGTAADFTARTTFAKSFFEAGGIEAVEANASSETALAEALASSKAALVCICSSDKVYAKEAESAAKALSAAGAKQIYLAGKGGELEVALRAAGVSDFIVAGGDALATLTAAHERIG